MVGCRTGRNHSDADGMWWLLRVMLLLHLLVLLLLLVVDGI